MKRIYAIKNLIANLWNRAKHNEKIYYYTDRIKFVENELAKIGIKARGNLIKEWCARKYPGHHT